MSLHHKYFTILANLRCQIYISDSLLDLQAWMFSNYIKLNMHIMLIFLWELSRSFKISLMDNCFPIPQIERLVTSSWMLPAVSLFSTFIAFISLCWVSLGIQPHIPHYAIIYIVCFHINFSHKIKNYSMAGSRTTLKFLVQSRPSFNKCIIICWIYL